MKKIELWVMQTSIIFIKMLLTIYKHRPTSTTSITIAPARIEGADSSSKEE